MHTYFFYEEWPKASSCYLVLQLLLLVLKQIAVQTYVIFLSWYTDKQHSSSSKFCHGSVWRSSKWRKTTTTTTTITIRLESKKKTVRRKAEYDWCEHSPVRIVNSGISAAGRMFWSSFSIILPDGFELLRLYSGLSGPLFFVFLSQAGHLLGTRTPQSDVRSMHKYIFFCGSRRPIRYDRECFFSLFFFFPVHL